MVRKRRDVNKATRPVGTFILESWATETQGKKRSKSNKLWKCEKIRSDSIEMICEKEKRKSARVTGVLIRAVCDTSFPNFLCFLPLNAPEHELNRVMGTIQRFRPVSRSEKRPCASSDPEPIATDGIPISDGEMPSSIPTFLSLPLMFFS